MYTESKEKRRCLNEMTDRQAYICVETSKL